MIPRWPTPISALPITKAFLTSQSRCLHAGIAAARIPKPTPFVPDPETFLKLIGRKMSQHAGKIQSWDALFSLSSSQMHELGIDPPRRRRYLLSWCEKFRRGTFGIGGDLTEVSDGQGELRIIEVPSDREGGAATLTKSPGMRKIVVNVPAGQEKPSVPLEKVKPVNMVNIVRGNIIGGPFVEAVKGQPGVAKIVAKEGLWEIKRGHKVDGGERRKAEVRSKRRAEERKTTRG